jgi:putative heme iron utilization protein
MAIRAFASALLATLSAGALAAPPLCATPDQAARVREAYATSPAAPAFMAAGRLGLAEAVVLSALPAPQATGTTGAGFGKVWESLQAWPDATTVLVKGGHVIEVRGRIPPGEPSAKSAFFNLKQAGAGLGGHLRPDLVGAIYAVDMAGTEGPLRGVTFVDTAGESLFGVYLPEGSGDQAALAAGFDRTRALIAALARACP